MTSDPTPTKDIDEPTGRCVLCGQDKTYDRGSAINLVTPAETPVPFEGDFACGDCVTASLSITELLDKTWEKL